MKKRLKKFIFMGILFIIILVAIRYFYIYGDSIKIGSINPSSDSCPEGIIPTQLILTQELMPFNPSGPFLDARSDSTVFNGYSKFSDKIVYSDFGFKWVLGNSHIPFDYYDSCSTWADGQNVCFYSGMNKLCHKGSAEGENINFVYCDLKYEKINSTTPISTDGVIGKTEVVTTSYDIQLVLKNESEIRILSGDPTSNTIQYTGVAPFVIDRITYYNVTSAICKKQ